VNSRRPLLALAAVVPWVLPVACFAIGEGVLPPRDHARDAGPPPLLHTEDAALRTTLDASLLVPLPHSVSSVDPAHGPFIGGQHAIVRGTGFTSQVRVWFGDTEVPHENVVPVDPGRVQISVPKGSGTVDVSAQNGDDETTHATLPEGYIYDPFYVDPSTGPVSGGTVITLHGDSTAWTLDTSVTVDGAPCKVTAVRSPEGEPQELDCQTPAGTPGSKRVDVGTASGTAELLDGFTYGDSNNGFRGGLSGSELAGTLHVVAVNSFTGGGIGGATVVLGSDVSSKSVKTADDHGVVVIQDPKLGSAVTVTIAAHCFMPQTFFGVAVDSVTAYLDPVLSPACLANGHPVLVGPGGGSSSVGASIQGELVWPNPIELKVASWDVPVPPELQRDADPDYRLVAYVFPLAPSLSTPFRLPSAGNGVTPEDVGRIGYTFSTGSVVGNVTLYALAGIENRKLSPPVFTAYTLGIVSGVATQAGATAKDVYVKMDIPLDHALSLDVHGPTPTPRGPDHVDGQVGVRYGNQGYITLPIAPASTPLPAAAPLRFVGLPPLVNALVGSEYVTTATASTGENGLVPRSVLGVFGTTTADSTLRLDGFVEVPVLKTPKSNGSWDGQTVATTFAPGGPDADLTVFDIDSGGGSSTWTVVMPRGTSSGVLPDLAALGDIGAPEGPVSITVFRARIDNFDYGGLRYADLASRGWDAYASDVFQAHR
jgi:hypothetical protein